MSLSRKWDLTLTQIVFVAFFSRKWYRHRYEIPFCSQKIKSPFVYIWFIWLNENLLFSFRYIKENILFGLVSFMVLRFFVIKGGGGMKGRETNIDRCLFDYVSNLDVKQFAKIMTVCSFFFHLSKNTMMSDGKPFCFDE